MQPAPEVGVVYHWGRAMERRGCESEAAVRGLMHWFGMSLEEAVETVKARGGRVRPAFFSMMKYGPDDVRLPEPRTETGVHEKTY